MSDADLPARNGTGLGAASAKRVNGCAREVLHSRGRSDQATPQPYLTFLPFHQLKRSIEILSGAWEIGTEP